jgi:transcriptional regulator with XRE-family HTH domain
MENNNIRNVFRKNLNYYLEERGYSQMELAKELKVATATVSEWCNGKKVPRMNNIEKIAKWLNVSISDLLEDKTLNKSNYHLSKETLALAYDIKNNDDLALLFDVARDSSPEDLELAHQMLLALKRENHHKDN